MFHVITSKKALAYKINNVNNPSSLAKLFPAASNPTNASNRVFSNTIYVAANPRNKLFPEISNPFRESGESLKLIFSKLGKLGLVT